MLTMEVSFGALFSSLAGSHHLTMYSDDLFFVYLGERELKLHGVSAFKGTNPIIKDIPSEPQVALITNQRACFQIPALWVLELLHVNWWGLGRGQFTSQ